MLVFIIIHLVLSVDGEEGDEGCDVAGDDSDHVAAKPGNQEIRSLDLELLRRRRTDFTWKRLPCF